MAWYFFSALWKDGRSGDASTTNLSGDKEARQYARLLIRELKERPHHSDPGMRVIVRNSNGDTIHNIPF